MRRSHVIAALLLTLLMSACGGATPSAAVPSASTPSMPPATPWEAELRQVAADGTRSLESALRLFAMAFGPVPGVEAPKDPGPILSGSPAVRAIRAHLDELTAGQRAAVERYLEVPADAVRVEVPRPAGSAEDAPAEALPGAAMLDLSSGGRSLGGRLAGLGTSRYAGPDQAFINWLWQTITDGRDALARKWTDFPGAVPIFITDEPLMALSWWEAIGGTADFQCRIVISGTGVDADQKLLMFSLLHELFHCAQAWRMRLDIDDIPAWVWEGGARFFAQDIIGLEGDEAWQRYMVEPQIPLFSRTYDAIGFWGHLRYALKADVYLSLEAALADGSNEQRFAVVGATAPAFLDTWASGLSSMVLPFGPAWRTDGPGLSPALDAPRQGMDVGPGDVEIVEQGAYSNQLYAVTAKTDLIRVEMVGHARIGDGSVDTTELASALFCVTDRGCQPCPDGPPLTQQPIRLSEVSILAISGGTEGTSGTVSGESLEDVCASPSPSPTPSPSDDQFCALYRDMIDWIAANTDPNSKLTKAVAREIARRSIEMQPVAPSDLTDEVEVFIRVYGTYASAPEPIDVPLAGREAVRLGEAFNATNTYCGVTFS